MWVCKHSLPLPSSPGGWPGTDGKLLQSSSSLPMLPALGWVRISGIPAAQQGLTRGEGRARNAWHPHLCPCKLCWAGQGWAAPGTFHWAGPAAREQSREGLEKEGGDLLPLKTPFTRILPKSCKAKHFQFSTSIKGSFLTSPHCYLFWKVSNENKIYFFPQQN